MPISEQDVLAVMRTEKRALKARQIASILRTESGNEVTRTEVNRLLYAMQTRGLVSSDEEHFWNLSGEAKYGAHEDTSIDHK